MRFNVNRPEQRVPVVYHNKSLTANKDDDEGESTMDGAKTMAHNKRIMPKGESSRGDEQNNDDVDGKDGFVYAEKNLMLILFISGLKTEF